MVEQGTENPCVGGSIPPLATTLYNLLFILFFISCNEPPTLVGGYENHPWFSPCGPACGCSNPFPTDLSIPPLATTLYNLLFILFFISCNEPPTLVGGYENHPWFSPCGPACGCSNPFPTDLSIPPLATIHLFIVSYLSVLDQ